MGWHQPSGHCILLAWQSIMTAKAKWGDESSCRCQKIFGSDQLLSLLLATFVMAFLHPNWSGQRDLLRLWGSWLGANRLRNEAELNLESHLGKCLYLQHSGFFSPALHKAHLGLRGCLRIAQTQRRLWFVEKEGFDVFGKQIAVLIDLQFLLASCKQQCLKKNKHPEVDGRVGRA